MDEKKAMIAIAIPEKQPFPEFPIPEGLDVVDLEDGDEKEVVAKIKKSGDMLMLVSVNGVSLDEEEGEEEDDMAEEEDEEEAVDEMDAVGDMAANNDPNAMSMGGRASSAGLM